MFSFNSQLFILLSILQCTAYPILSIDNNILSDASLNKRVFEDSDSLSKPSDEMTIKNTSYIDDLIYPSDEIHDEDSYSIDDLTYSSDEIHDKDSSSIDELTYSSDEEEEDNYQLNQKYSGNYEYSSDSSDGISSGESEDGSSISKYDWSVSAYDSADHQNAQSDDDALGDILSIHSLDELRSEKSDNEENDSGAAVYPEMYQNKDNDALKYFKRPSDGSLSESSKDEIPTDFLATILDRSYFLKKPSNADTSDESFGSSSHFRQHEKVPQSKSKVVGSWVSLGGEDNFSQDMSTNPTQESSQTSGLKPSFSSGRKPILSPFITKWRKGKLLKGLTKKKITQAEI